MKKIISVITIITATAIAFSSCSKVENQVETTIESPKTVTFNAVSPETKTTFGTFNAGKYPTIWTANDSQIKIAQNYSDGVNATVAKISDTKSSFSASITDDESGSYTFYAISPASAVVSGVNPTYYSWNLEIPTTQTPTATGPDESAMILAATSSTEGTFPSTVDLEFSHITAYVKMSITNLGLAVGDDVASVLITANANIAYRYYYYVGGTKVGTLEENSAKSSITVLTSSASDIWFACAPMEAGTKLTISVTTKNSKVYTKDNITTPSALASGHVASFNVNFSGITPSSDKVYNRVTSYSQLTAGSKVIIAAVGDSDYAAGIGTTSDNFISAVSQAKSADDSKITNPAATVDVFTIEAGGTANTIALNGTNGYLYAKSSSSNNMGIQTTNDVNGYWTPTIVDAETGEMSLVATGSSNRNYMHYNYNSGSPRFSCYASNSSVTDLQALYKLEGSGSGPSLITTYTVTYNGNGNTEGSAPSSITTSGPFTVAGSGTLVKTGYVFNGWNTADDGSGTSYDAGTAAVATADITLYAKWADAGLFSYVLETVRNSSNSAYANSFDVTINGMSWNAPGNQNFEGKWRIGGNSITNQDRVLYARSGMGGNVNSIVIATAGISDNAVSVNSITITAHPTSNDARNNSNVSVTFTTSDELSFSTATNKNITFTKSGTTDCTGLYFRIVFNITKSITKSSKGNAGLDLTGITFSE